jgi:Calcineurin-like phosphoesterase
MVAKKSTGKPAGKTRSGKASVVAKAKANAAASGFVFANPTSSPDDYSGFTTQEKEADSNVQAAAYLQPFPKSRQPEVLSLSQVLGQTAVDAITKAGSIVFHSVGDTGGVKEPSKQFAVADAMAKDLAGKTYQTGQPAFFYHLGDVVYFLGQEQYYYDQFYDPYRNYDAPIFAIPGNHDGMVAQSGKQKSLAGFLENFCTTKPGPAPEEQQFARTTMTQPGVYFTLDAPFVKIIGLYSNTSEGATQGVISGSVAGTAQITFLQQQLKAAAAARKGGNHFALIIAVHHPAFTGSDDHVPSSNVLRDLDAACQQAGILPDIVMSGHAHLYERFTRYKGGNQIPFLVAGMGGYFNLSGEKPSSKGGAPLAPPVPPVTTSDYQNNKLILEAYNDTNFGFLRLAVSANTLKCQFFGVDVDTRIVTPGDSFTLDLNHHTVSTP